MFERRSQNDDSKPNVANLGVARPPIIYLTAIVMGVVLQAIWPIRFALESAMPLGVLFVVLAVVLFIWSVRTFHSAHTPVPGNQPTTAIVTVGPYRFSRNPIYLAFSVFQVGIAVGTNSAWLLVTVFPAMALMSFVVNRARSDIWLRDSGRSTRATGHAFGAGCELKSWLFSAATRSPG